MHITKERLTERVKLYWSSQAERQKRLRQKEMADAPSGAWLDYLNKKMPAAKTLDILDVGTGTGYLAGLMASQGHNATGIDLVPEMLQQAKILAESRNLQVRFMEMDAERLCFEDASFDLLLSRNVTWTLPDPKKAYAEWFRVLRPGGILLNFDSDYRSVRFEEQSEEHKDTPTYQDFSLETLRECDAIKDSMPITEQERPAWDLRTLSSTGFTDVSVDMNINALFFNKQDEFYNPIPMFCVRARK